ncbi:hypothetical protein [Candidatus Methylospira mobilis]|nr:hypothetical protein [Candidatus Methylospira mobilis]
MEPNALFLIQGVDAVFRRYPDLARGNRGRAQSHNGISRRLQGGGAVMRFFANGEHNRRIVLNTIVPMFLGYIVLFWISNGLMYFHKMSLNPQSVVACCLGSPETFTEPKSYQSLLKVSHFHLFSMVILVVTLMHLLLFTSVSLPLKIGLTLITFASAVTDELSSWLIRFVHPGFAWLKISAFVLLETSLLLSILVIWSLLSQRKTLS